MNLLRLNKKTHPIYFETNFLSDEEIDDIIKLIQKIPSVAGEIGGKVDSQQKVPLKVNSHIKNVNRGNVPRIRNSTIRWISLNEETNWIYKKIIQQIHKANQENFDLILKFVEDLQFTEYNENKNGFYAKHCDCSDEELIENFVDIRKLSFSIQMSSPEDYVGGELIFYINGEKFIAPKNKGTIIFFKSNILHEVTPVIKGTRYSLVSWVQGPNLR